MTRLRRKALLLGGAVAIVAAISGFVVGAQQAERADWQSATAEVIGRPEHPLAKIEADGWTYAIEGSVPRWIGHGGDMNENGWPTCLRPNAVGTSTQEPREVPIRFAAMDVDVDGHAWRHVVVVDCRPAG